jgi:hypothetical protein
MRPRLVTYHDLRRADPLPGNPSEWHRHLDGHAAYLFPPPLPFFALLPPPVLDTFAIPAVGLLWVERILTVFMLCISLQKK